MERKIVKATAISDAKIQFVSLVNKAANKKQFLITKGDDGSANFQSFGRIVKSDDTGHLVTGIVYEPLVEDSQGNYMTEQEIEKAAHWFMKNDGDVDVQHCFEKAEGCEVVETFIAKSDMDIEGEPIKKGTWLMTMEVTDDTVWDSIQKGEIAGFSMGGMGVYSDEDVELEAVDKSEVGFFKKLAKAFGMEVVEKGAVKDNFKRRVKEDNFYSAWYALKSTLEGSYYNADTGTWEWGYNQDETTITEALTDFNDIVTQVLTSDGSIVKSLEKAAKEAPEPINKAGKSLSTKNLETLQGINSSLTDFLSGFTSTDDNSDGEGDGDGVTKSVDKKTKKKEDDEMKQSEAKELVEETVTKAMEPIVKQLELLAKGDDEGNGGTPAPASEPVADGEVTGENLSSMVNEAVAKSMEPITAQLEVIRKSRALPSNLNDQGENDQIQKSEQHYLHGIL